MKHSRLFVLALSLLCSAFCLAHENSAEALDGALAFAKASLPVAQLQGKSLAVLPILKDSTGMMTGKVKNMLTSAGLICLEGKEDPMWNEIIKEIAWSEKKDDILDNSQIVTFGKLKAVQVLVYGQISVLDVTKERVYAEIDLHATDVATRQHVWGGTFAKRLYLSPELQGLVDIPMDVRALLRRSFEEAKASLTSGRSNFSKVHTVSVVPFAGDVKEYVTGLAVEMLTQTSLVPRNPRISSVSQMRAMAREGGSGMDALMYGSVRDFSQKVTDVRFDAEKRQKITEYVVNADIQLFIEDAKSGDVLWSRSIMISDPKSETKALTEAEYVAEQERIERERLRKREIDKKQRKEMLEDLQDNLKVEAATKWKTILKWLAIIVAIPIVVVILLAIFKGIFGNVFIK